MYNLHCTLYIVQCTMYNVHCTMYAIPCKMYGLKYCINSSHWYDSLPVILGNTSYKVKWLYLLEQWLYLFSHLYLYISYNDNYTLLYNYIMLLRHCSLVMACFLSSIYLEYIVFVYILMV